MNVRRRRLVSALFAAPLAAPVAAGAQSAGRTLRVGYLGAESAAEVARQLQPLKLPRTLLLRAEEVIR